MDDDATEAERVLSALRQLDKRIEEMLGQSPEGKKLAPWVESSLRQETVDLKADIKAAARRGTILDDREPQTALESAYYNPALREASARFLLRTDTSPSSQKWRSGLRTVQGEITYYIWSMEREYPEA